VEGEGKIEPGATAKHEGTPRTVWLLLSLVALILVNPHVGGMRHGAIVMASLVSVVLVAGVFAVSVRRSMFVAAVVLALPAIAGGFLVPDSAGSRGEAVVLVLRLLFFAFVAYRLLSSVFRPGVISRDRLAASVCVYLLLGFVWGIFYQLQETLHPGSFGALSAGGAMEAPLKSDLIYFSYVTLTTLGYGDITPLSAYARSSAILEAVAGPMYIAVLIARLVGLYGKERA
jgi:hypothetical protein